MRNHFKPFFLLLSLALLLQAAVLPAQNLREEGNALYLRSNLLGHELKLTIQVPEHYKASKKRYTTLYFVHGNEKSVSEVAAIAQKLYQEKHCPELIIVGIEDPETKIDRMENSPNYDRFLSFMERELFPTILKNYRSNGQRLLYEKSLTGSFTLYAFLNRPTLFNGYIAASKQWYDQNNQSFTALAKKRMKNPAPFKGRKIFLATLNGAYNNNNIPEVNQQMKAFSELLCKLSGDSKLSQYQVFDDWGISPQPGFKEGLAFVCPNLKSAPAKSAGLSMVQSAEGKWVIQNKKKERLYDVFIYDNGPDYASEGLIRVVKDGKIGYADAKTYVLVIAPQFDCAYPFENGKAKVSTNCKSVQDGEHFMWTSDSWQFVDKQGK